MWQDLIEVLGKICAVYDDLGRIGERKRDALIKVDMKDLAKILDEEQRGSILKELSKNFKNVNSNTKAMDFYRNAPNVAIRSKLTSLHGTLTKSVERAVMLRDNNQVLAQSALNAVKFHLNRLSGATINPTYGKQGGSNVTHEKNFDFKA